MDRWMGSHFKSRFSKTKVINRGLNLLSSAPNPIRQQESPLLNVTDSEDDSYDTEDFPHIPGMQYVYAPPKRGIPSGLVEPTQATCVLVYFLVLVLVSICFTASYCAYRWSLPPPKQHGSPSFLLLFRLPLVAWPIFGFSPDFRTPGPSPAISGSSRPNVLCISRRPVRRK